MSTDPKKEKLAALIYAAIRHKQGQKAIVVTPEDLPLKKRHICPRCGAIFPTATDLYTHKYNNLWEDYYKVLHRVPDPHLCIFCGQRFGSKDSFLAHWYGSKTHEDFGLTFLQMGQVKAEKVEGEWEISKTEDLLLQKRLKNDPELKACKRGYGAGEYIAETVRGRLLNKENLVGEAWGIQGSGKSNAVLSFIHTYMIPEIRKAEEREWLENDEHYAAAIVHQAEQKQANRQIDLGQAAYEVMHIRDEWHEPYVYITFSMAQTLQAWREARRYDVIMQDEDPGLVGHGSDTAKAEIQNLLKMMRKKLISVWFISPVQIDYVKTANLTFEFTHKKRPLKERICRGIHYDREHDSIGWFQFKLLPANDPRIIEYERLKDENLDTIQINLGAESVEINWTKVDEERDRAYRGFLGRYGTLQALGEMSVAYLTKRISGFGVKGQGDYQTLVAEELFRKIQEDLAKKHLAELEGGQPQVPSEAMGSPQVEKPPETVPRFTMNDLDYIPYLEKEGGIEGKYLTAYPKYLSKDADYRTLPLVATSIGLSSSGNISEQFDRIRGRIAELRGGLFEIEMLRLYSTAEGVVAIQPPPVFAYPRGVQPEGSPDRIITLINGTIRVCGWKAYGGDNATVELGRMRHEEFTPCPEILEARRLIDMGGNQTLIKVIMEGVFCIKQKDADGSLVTMAKFFQQEIDPYTEAKSFTINRRALKAWPPSSEQLTGIKARTKVITVSVGGETSVK